MSHISELEFSFPTNSIASDDQSFNDVRPDSLEESRDSFPVFENSKNSICSRKRPADIGLIQKRTATIPVTPSFLRRMRSKQQSSETVYSDYKKRMVKKKIQNAKIIRNASENKGFNFSVGKTNEEVQKTFLKNGINFTNLNGGLKIQKFESMAEKCLKFKVRTPIKLKEGEQPKRTRPISPKFLTKDRVRGKPAYLLSQKEKEELEFLEHRKLQFKATKLNKKIFEKPKLTLRPISLPYDPDFDAEKKNNLKNSTKENTPPPPLKENLQFHANPLPVNIIKGTVGVKPRKSIMATEPMSPAFSRLNATRKYQSLLQEMSKKKEPLFKANPVPSFPTPAKPQLEHKFTQPKPFSFDEKDSERLMKKEEKIWKIIKEEREAHEFYANPLPNLEYEVPAKRAKMYTLSEPFDFEIEKRLSVHQEEQKKLLEEKENEERKKRNFKARPATVLHKKPFTVETHGESMSQTFNTLSDEERGVPSNLEKRSLQWKERETWMAKKQEMMDQIARENEKKKQEEEEKEVKILREQMVHKANPIRKYKKMEFPFSKPISCPESPNFSKRLSRQPRENLSSNP